MAHTDITPTYLIQKLPQNLQPYALLMRLDRPIGTWLLLVPSLWGITATATTFEHIVWLSVLFSAGAIIMRGAGCIINDLWDKDIDAQVERTKNRPLAAGVISKKKALLCLGLLLALGLLILLQLTPAAMITGLISLVPITLYPLAKRFIWYPQAILGITFNMGVLIGWASVTGNLASPIPWLIYTASFFWTMGYDTIYAHQDKTDDALVGVKSTALKFGKRSKIYIGIFYGCAVFLLGLAGLIDNKPPVFYVALTAFTGALSWQILRWKQDDPVSCLSMFRSNRDAGILMLIGYLSSHII